MTNSEKAQAILAATYDGNNLTPEDLRLVEIAVSNQLTERGQEQLESLYQEAISGEYNRDVRGRWFHGIEHLTKDHQGYVYWKGKHVEHYSFSDEEREAQAAQKLAGRCLLLESKGFPVNSRTALYADCYDAPAGTPWFKALSRYYTFFKNGDQVVGIFYRDVVKNGEPEVVAAYKSDEGICQTLYPGAYEAYHALVAKGLESAGSHNTYEETLALLERTGLSGAEIQNLITATA